MRALGTAVLVLGLVAPAAGADLRQFGAVAGGPDCTPALNAAVAAARDGVDKTVRIPAGQWMFQTAPAPITGGVRLIGEGKGQTILTRTYSDGEFLLLAQNGSEVRDLTLWAGAGTAGGLALHLIADDGPFGAGGNHRIQDVWITSGTGGTWALPLFLNGAARTLAPVGLRAVRLDNVTIFNATWWAVEWWNCIACEWIGGGVYQGAGTTEAIVVGGTLAQRNWIQADLNWAVSVIWPGAMRSR